MKKLAILFVGLLLSFKAMGQFTQTNGAALDRWQNSFTTIYTNQIANTFTNSQNFTNVIDVHNGVYGTLQYFWTATGTNTSTNWVQRSLDNVNWISVQTNNLGGSASLEYTFQGAFYKYRFILIGLQTNATQTINLLEVQNP